MDEKKEGGAVKTKNALGIYLKSPLTRDSLPVSRVKSVQTDWKKEKSTIAALQHAHISRSQIHAVLTERWFVG